MNEQSWPEDWDERRRGVGCPKCASGRADVDESGGERFSTGRFADGYLQRRGPQPGYTIVAFHLRHVADLMQFTEEESAGFWQDVVAVATALVEVFRPCHMNYNVLGNGVPHVHAHVIPRYLGPVPRHAVVSVGCTRRGKRGVRSPDGAAPGNARGLAARHEVRGEA